MKRMVKTLALLASLAVAASVSACKNLAGGNGTGGGETASAIIEFGRWPQSKKADSVTVDESDSEVVGMFTYYKGSDGEQYAKVSSDYYKVEPIKWRVLTNNYNGNKLLLAECALMPVQYYDNASQRTIDSDTVYANNYKHSKVRAWLNGIAYKKGSADNEEYNGKGFLQTAFTTDEQGKINNTTVDNSAESTNPDGDATLWNSGSNQYACENTSDKIFLLSEKEATTESYGFAKYNVYIRDGNGTTESARRIIPTEFAVAHGADKDNSTGGSHWWLRSPYYDPETIACFIHAGGNASGSIPVFMSIGVVPALSIAP
ncbi:MAG: hypothetical protein IJR50_00070 [Treponema sp.]|nr:hypothetical protein [Treponema sp.]